jgi:uncharacterized protein (TIGR03435 family)
MFLTLCATAVAQLPELTPAFEVASIKKSESRGGLVLYHLPGGRFKAKSTTLLNLISFAYEVPEAQVIGLPRWGVEDQFDIEATGDGPAESDPKKMETPRKRAMVRRLLAERFQLELRQEERNIDIYSLVVSSGGSKMERNSDKPYMIQGRKMPCTFQKVSMADFAKYLTSSLRTEIGRVVVDKTGLEGDFDFQLRWNPFIPGRGAAADPLHPPTIGAGDGLSLFTAIQQQLGLRLQSDRGVAPFLIAVKASHPTAN